MYISRSNGMLNKDVLPQRDTLINANTLLGLNKNRYTKKQMKEFEELYKRNKETTFKD